MRKSKEIETHDNREDKFLTMENPWAGSFQFVCKVFMAILLLFVGLRILFSSGAMRGLPPWLADIVFSFLSQVVIMAIVPIIAMHYFLKKKRKNTILSTLSTMGFKKISVKMVLWAVLLGVLMYLFNIVVASFFNGILLVFGFRFPSMSAGSFHGFGGLLISLLIIAILPSTCEEVSHRGMLLNGFASRMGIMRAMLWSSVLFGFMHLNVVQFFYAAILGYLIALATMGAKNLWVGVILHFMNNGIGTYLSFAGRYGWIGGDWMNRIFGMFTGAGVILYLAFVVALYMSIMAIIRMLARGNYKKSKQSHIEKLLAVHPSYGQTKAGSPIPFEQVIAEIDEKIEKMPKWNALKFYIDPSTITKQEKVRLTPGEGLWFWGTIALGTVITVMTLIWGFL